MPIILRRLHYDPNWIPFRCGNVARIVTVCLITGGFVYGIYNAKLEDTELAQAMVVHRALAMQGEVWWAVDNDVSVSGPYDDHSWKDELAYIVSPDEASTDQGGMRYLMIKILGPEIAYSICDTGYLYTMAYPAILIATSPYVVALLIQFVAGVIFFVFVYYLFFCVAYGRYARAMLALLVTFPFTVAMATGNFFVFCTCGMSVKIAILLYLESIPLCAKQNSCTPGDDAAVIRSSREASLACHEIQLGLRTDQSCITSTSDRPPGSCWQ